MRDAQDLATTVVGLPLQMWFWVFILAGIACFSFGSAWFIGLSWDIIAKWRNQHKKAYKFKHHRTWDVLFDDAIIYVCDSSIYGKGLSESQGLIQAFGALVEKIKTGELALAGMPAGSPEQRKITPEEIKEYVFDAAIDRPSYSNDVRAIKRVFIKDKGEKPEKKFSGLFVDRAQLEKIWPRRY